MLTNWLISFVGSFLACVCCAKFLSYLSEFFHEKPYHSYVLTRWRNKTRDYGARLLDSRAHTAPRSRRHRIGLGQTTGGLHSVGVTLAYWVLSEAARLVCPDGALARPCTISVCANCTRALSPLHPA